MVAQTIQRGIVGTAEWEGYDSGMSYKDFGNTKKDGRPKEANLWVLYPPDSKTGQKKDS